MFVASSCFAVDSGFQDIDAGESAIAEAIQQIDAQKQEAAGIPSVWVDGITIPGVTGPLMSRITPCWGAYQQWWRT